MPAIRKFLFDHDFDAPPPAKAAEVPAAEAQAAEEPEEEEYLPPPPTFSEEELAAAREQSFEAGRQAALQEAAASDERMLAQAIAGLAQALEQIERQQKEANQRIAEDAARIAVAITRKVLPATAERAATDEIEALVAECIPHLLDEERIVLRVPPPLVEEMRQRIEAVTEMSGFEGRMVVAADSRLAGSDCRVEWTDGGADRSLERLWREIDAVIEKSFAEAERPQMQPAETLPA
ncbi:FliH/SctL family protein [Telmatospirillum sp. J64-1]|uniref:FliH/SctL family protein n=1 Tax=Telmatospirillum sp. J64-1 TaxID=2502183 RepID=UPI00115DBBF2|nr:FliH/SctL family protein [Telmatospirillum sp. J64-1]